MSEEKIEANGQALMRPQVAALSLVPRTLAEAMEFAKLIASSNLCPKDYRGKPADVLLAVQLGLEVAGTSPLQSLQNIAVINGRPCMWGDLVLGVIRNSGLLESISERDPQECLAKNEGRCEVTRTGDERSVVRTFTTEMATQAGLIKRATADGPWNTHRGRMLQMRARSWALRDVFPDVLKGLRLREEEQDLAAITVEPIIRTLPRRASETAAIDAFLSESSGAVQPQAGQQGGGSSIPGNTAPHESPPGNVYVGAISEVTTKTGESKKGTWTLYVVKTPGGDFGTFSASIGELAQRFASQHAAARIEFTITPKGSKNIESLTEYEVPATAEPDEPGADG